MPLTTAKSWPLSSYTDNTWTDIVAEVATLATVLLSNTTASTTITAELRIESGGSTVAQILPPVDVAPGVPQVLDVRSINILTGQKLQGRFSGAGMHAFASGAV